MVFDQKININEIFNRIRVIYNDNDIIHPQDLELIDDTTAKKEFELLFNENETNHEQYIAFTFKNDLLKATQYIVEIAEGCPSAEGPLKSQRSWTARFHTYKSLRLTSWSPNRDHDYQPTAVPGQTWSLTFNNSLDHSTITKSIFKFEPEVNGLGKHR